MNLSHFYKKLKAKLGAASDEKLSLPEKLNKYMNMKHKNKILTGVYASLIVFAELSSPIF